MRAGHHQLPAAEGLPRGAQGGGAGARRASSCKRRRSGNRSSNSKRAAAAVGEGRELRCNRGKQLAMSALGQHVWISDHRAEQVPAPFPACYPSPSLPLRTSLRLRCTSSRTSARASTWRCSAATSTWRCRAPRSWMTRTPGTGWVSGDRLGEPRSAAPGLTRHLAIACGVHVGPCAQLQCAM